MLRNVRGFSLFRIRVSGLPFGARSSDILNLFAQYNPLGTLPVKSPTQKDLGQAFVSFSCVEDAIRASTEMNGMFFQDAVEMLEVPRRVSVACDFKGPRIVEEVFGPKKPTFRKLIKQVRDKAVGGKWPTEPVMASTNESRMIRRYKTGGLPRSHDRQR